MNDARHEVVGVAPRGFVFRAREVDYWIPMRLPPRLANTRNSHFLNVVARLKPGVAVEAADREMKWIAAQLTQEYPDTNRDVGAVVVSVREDVLGDMRVEVLVLDDRRRIHRPDRMREPCEPAAVPRMGETR